MFVLVRRLREPPEFLLFAGTPSSPSSFLFVLQYPGDPRLGQSGIERFLENRRRDVRVDLRTPRHERVAPGEKESIK